MTSLTADSETVRDALLRWYDPDAPCVAALARLEAAANRTAAAEAWFENHFVDEDGEPAGRTLAQMMEHVYRWGDGAWGTAGQETERRVAAEAERDAALAALREIVDDLCVPMSQYVSAVAKAVRVALFLVARNDRNREL